MGSTILDWILTAVPLWVGCLLIVVIATVYLTNKYSEAKHRIKKTEDKIDDLPCKAREEQYHKIMDKLETISLALVAIKPSTLNALTVKKSPRQLNDYGKLLFDDCNGLQFLEDNKTFLLGEIEKRQPKTALDVETLANEILMLNLNLDIFNKLKNWVYNSPTRKLKNQEGEEVDHIVSMGDICIVLSLPLRDMYLAAHPDLERV